MANSIAPSLDDLFGLTKSAIYPFLQVYRATPLRFQPGRHENDAEHSWSVAFVACALAPQIDSSLDVGKIAQFATVHDLVEVYAGDTSNLVPEKEKKTKEVREQAAFEKLKTELTVFPWICETIDAYESQVSEEAKFVKTIDKIMVLLFDVIDEGAVYKENHITIEAWQQKMKQHREKARRHAAIFQYYDQLWNLILSNPHFFYTADK
jgi:putative hydrolase of HD superfamily